RAPSAGAARRVLEERRSGRGPQPVRAVSGRGRAARRLRRAARGTARAARRPRAGLCRGRPPGAAAGRAARAAGLARRPRRARGPAHARRLSLGGRELTTGSDLDLFVTFGRADADTADGETDGPERVDAHAFYSGAVERLASALGDITPAGIAFAVDLRLRPGSKGSGFAAGADALERYYEEHGDLWERQSLTRARLLLGDRALARRVRATLRRLGY